MESTFGLRLRIARDAAGLTQSKVASTVGIASQAVARYEHDDDTPRDDRARALAAAVGVSVSWLRFGEGFGPAITHDPRVKRQSDATPEPPVYGHADTQPVDRPPPRAA